MYDPKFEKGVRQKMEGLEFIPSESVWANVQKSVAGQRRRKGGAYFWRFAVSGLLLAGIAGVLYHAARPTAQVTKSGSVAPASVAATHPSPVTKSVPAAPAALVPAATNRPDVRSQASAAGPNANAAGSNRNAASSDADAAEPRTSKAELRANGAEPRTNAMALHANPAYPRANAAIGVGAAGTRIKGNRTFAHNGTIAPGRTVANDGTRGYGTAEKDHSADGNAFADAERQVAANAPEEANNTSTHAGASSIAPYFYQPGLVVRQRSAAAIKAARLSLKSSVVALSSLEKANRPWEAGFVAGGGISRLNRLNISNGGNQALSASLYNVASAAAAPSKNYVADVRPDVSFMAGIYLQKGVSSRWTLNLGMNLHYYSTKISIGEPVSTYVPVTVSLIAPTVNQSAQTSTAYIAGDKQNFTNHYYFLELPVNMQYRLNKSKMLPIFAEGGFSLARLMGSDALFYNAHSGVYYKDPAVLQKTQVNISSGLMVGLPFHGIRIEAGPQVQYGLTPLINNHNQGDQHFLYTGLRVVILPGRK